MFGNIYQKWNSKRELKRFYRRQDAFKADLLEDEACLKERDAESLKDAKDQKQRDKVWNSYFIMYQGRII